MRVLKEAHLYELESVEGTNPQLIQFIEKAPDNNWELKTVTDGTTNEDLIKVLLDRLKSLNGQFYCKENHDSINHLEKALAAQHARTANRKKRSVEGKHTL